MNFNNSELRRSFFVGLIFLFLTVMWILNPTFSFSRTGYASMGLVLVASLLSFVERPDRYILNEKLILLAMLLGVGYLITFIQQRDTNRLVMAFSFGIFPIVCGFFLSTKRNRQIFFRGYSIGSSIGLMLLYIASIIFAPLLEGQYYSILLNPNELSTVLIPMGISFLYMIEKSREAKDKKHMIYYLIIYALSFSLMFLSLSRTGILIYILSIVIWIFYISFKLKSFMSIIKNIIITVLIIFLFNQITIFNLNGVSKGIIAVESKVFDRAYIYSGKYHGFIDKEHINQLSKKSLQLSKVAEERFTKGSREGEDVSSGRFNIWMAALDEIGLKGHRQSDEFFVPYRNKYTNDTHNFYLAIGYFLGFPFMIVTTVLMAYVLLMTFIDFIKVILKKKKINSEMMLQWSIIGGFFILSMLSTTYTSFGSIIGSIFWVSLPWFKNGEN